MNLQKQSYEDENPALLRETTGEAVGRALLRPLLSYLSCLHWQK